MPNPAQPPRRAAATRGGVRARSCAAIAFIVALAAVLLAALAHRLAVGGR